MMSHYLEKFRDLVRSLNNVAKVAILISADLSLLFVSLVFSYWIRLGYVDPSIISDMRTFWVGIAINIVVLYAFSIYNVVSSVHSRRTERRIFQAQVLSVLLWAFFILSTGREGFPRSVLVIYGGVSALALMMWRRLIAAFLAGSLALFDNAERDNVIIYGADRNGARLAEEITQDKTMQAVGFVDDDERVFGRRVSGLKVFPLDQLPELVRLRDVKAVLLTKSSLKPKGKMELVDMGKQVGFEVRVVPPHSAIASGRTMVSEMRPFSIEDLLGRAPAKPRRDLIDMAVAQKSVLITGAGGSIGAELSRQAVRNGAGRVVLMDNCEFNLFQIEREINQEIGTHGLDVAVTAQIGDVRERLALERAIGENGVDIVFHAAAYKHVDLVERNAIAAIANNVIGTLEAARAAEQAKVARFVLISTDKAVRPVGMMGATKRMAEQIIQAMDRQTTTTTFSAVRFGNVLGSSGSVVPLFKEQIANGGPVTVTHREVERYFMLIPEAAALVVQAAAMAQGGEIFLLKMENSVRIVDLARTMIQLSGYVPYIGPEEDGDIEIIFTGLKPGEKLVEELFIGEAVRETEHDRILCCQEDCPPWEAIEGRLQQLKALMAQNDRQASEAAVKLVKAWVSSEHVQVV